MRIASRNIKGFLKKIYSYIHYLNVFCNSLLNQNPFSTKKPKIYYGGAPKGNIGGPLVKIKKLNYIFPCNSWNFNIVYLLSNSLFLPFESLKIIKQKNIPIILNQNGVFYEAWFKGNYKKENLQNSQYYHFVDYVIWQSNFCKKASEKFLGPRAGKGKVLYNSVDTEKFIPRENKLQYKKRFNLLITGNVRKNNNYRILTVLDALKDLIQENNFIHLIIAGFIQDKKFLLEKIVAFGLTENIHFIENYTQKDAPKIYQIADAYITLTFQDNCPSAVIEALATGLPVIYSASGGIPELVDKSSGIGLKVKEDWKEIKVPKKTDIQNGILKIIENHDEMSLAARSRAIDFFDIKKWYQAHSELFDDLLTNNR